MPLRPEARKFYIDFLQKRARGVMIRFCKGSAEAETGDLSHFGRFARSRFKIDAAAVFRTTTVPPPIKDIY